MFLSNVLTKHFCFYCLPAFSAEKILRCHFNDSFTIKGKQMIQMPKNREYVRKDYKITTHDLCRF